MAGFWQLVKAILIRFGEQGSRRELNVLSFVNDYSEGAHESILKALLETNKECLCGYGSDKYCLLAKEKIRIACNCPDADIYFLMGGTQTNRLVISSLLAPYQGVIAVTTGHISTHEAGAIESSGHKVLEIRHAEGKLLPEALKKYMEIFHADENRSHMVFPGMVYISYPTEYGTLYTKQELKGLRSICNHYKLPLFIDGARLAYGLASEECDLSFSDIAELSDVFYFGGTKVGALCGEALVFTKNNTPNHFITMIKQQGALLAKGRLLGVQFNTLFTDDLYCHISKNAIKTADCMKAGFWAKGYRLYLDSPTNQVFIIMENSRMLELSKHVAFSFWEQFDEKHTLVRFATGWTTHIKDVQHLIEWL